MNIKQQAHTKMFVAVLGVLDSFKTIWQAATAFASARDALAAADRICERQLDRLMERHQTSNADFYGAYQVALHRLDGGERIKRSGRHPACRRAGLPARRNYAR